MKGRTDTRQESNKPDDHKVQVALERLAAKEEEKKAEKKCKVAQAEENRRRGAGKARGKRKAKLERSKLKKAKNDAAGKRKAELCLSPEEKEEEVDALRRPRYCKKKNRSSQGGLDGERVDTLASKVREIELKGGCKIGRTWARITPD
ncbi:hypothetical protein [Roseibacillus ishigakijimensis]|uniref:Uncharacterized protein n=1 Tax=Roseibacillus ishigakijimensis TaxID=454146 RepID=A0A934VM06_9BACT|nr:hypothetical protein [Roseibacillus ishigakijimensis]MBK1835234.1 hypothetical protein [Roseibacillus ishigakijimensis]